MGGLYGVDLGADLGGSLADGGGGDVGEAVVLLEDEVGEVKASGGASEVEHRRVVGPSRRDRGGVGAEPNPRPLVRLSYLRHPLPPLPHPYSSVRLLRLLTMIVMTVIMMMMSLLLLSPDRLALLGAVISRGRTTVLGLIS